MLNWEVLDIDYANPGNSGIEIYGAEVPGGVLVMTKGNGLLSIAFVPGATIYFGVLAPK